MSKEDTGPASTDTAAAQAEARQAERARIAGITSSDEAKGREKLASHLALNTDLSVDSAKAILAAAPVEKAEPPATTTKAGTNPFQQAMDAGKHPNVGADAGTGDGGTGEMTDAQRILADHSAMTGIRYDKAKA
jgi:hypothetical protein